MRLLALITFVGTIEHVAGHAYMYWPKSREAQREQGKSYNGATWWGYPAAWGMVAHTKNSKRDNHPFNDMNYESQYGIGDGHAENNFHQHPADFSAWLCNGIEEMPPVATYKQGGDIEIVIVQNAEHGGHHDFRICPKDWSSLKSNKEKAECLDMWLIGCEKPSDCGNGKICKCGHQCSPTKECGCYSDGCKGTNPGGDANDKKIYKHGPPLEGSLVHGSNTFNLKLPKDLYCDKCTLQWVWQTTRNGEQFANCADIKIEPSGNTGGGSDRRRKAAPPAKDDSRRRRSKDKEEEKDDSRRRRSKDKEDESDDDDESSKDDSRRRRSKKSPRRRTKESSRRRRRSKKSTRRRRRRSKKSKGRRRRRSKSRRRRRRSSRRRRRRKSSSMMASKTTSSHDGYENLGCIAAQEGDTDEIGDQQDMQCATAQNSTHGVCRSGLPFYRVKVQDDPVPECGKFCLSKGLDLFGVRGEECRCGATQMNRVWGKSWFSAKDGLSVKFSNVVHTGECTGFLLFRQLHWLDGAPGEDLPVRGKDDAEYVDGVIQGWVKSTP